jgi:RNA polymerase sigma factor (TIGR02999 family)
MSTGSHFNHALDGWRAGDPAARDAVFALAYDDLRAIARRQLARLPPGQTLAPTVLVHEAYVKFAERSAPRILDREHFFGIAARAMRHLVIDHLRRRQAAKRDPGVTAPLASNIPAPKAASALDLLALDEALNQLEILDARQARIVELRFFAGMELSEIAASLNLSERTVKRDWQSARAFLGASLH